MIKMAEGRLPLYIYVSADRKRKIKEIAKTSEVWNSIRRVVEQALDDFIIKWEQSIQQGGGEKK